MLEKLNFVKKICTVDNIFKFICSDWEFVCSLDRQMINTLRETIEFKEYHKLYKDFEKDHEECERILNTYRQFIELKAYSPNFTNNIFLNPEKLISEYELLLKYKEFLPFFKFDTVDYYRNSEPISLVDDKVFQAFEIIKKDLNINQAIELRVIPASIYKKHTNINASGFFDSSCPGVIYITKETLKRHPSRIIFAIVHELEHYRQFWCYPDSFAWTPQNKESLGEEEFYRQLEYGADKRATEYFKCATSSFIVLCCQNYLFKDPKGYFTIIDSMPYFFKNLFSSSKGSLKNSNDILDYLPSSGIYWNQINIGLCTLIMAKYFYDNHISSANIIK